MGMCQNVFYFAELLSASSNEGCDEMGRNSVSVLTGNYLKNCQASIVP